MFEIWSLRQLEWMMDNRRDQFLLIDLRSPEHFQQGHLDGAVNLPLEDWKEEDASFCQDRQLVFYCEHGGRSMQAARALGRKGFCTVSLGCGIGLYRGKHWVFHSP